MDVVVSRPRGALFDGRAENIMRAGLEQALDDVAQQGYADVMHHLDLSIRNPTPYYETQVIWERAVEDRVIHDRGIIYGPWLEGVGSRNKTTRFKGYFTFRRVGQALQVKASAIAERAVALAVGRINRGG